jgi:histidinol-phosphatase (PHP family)
MIFIVLGKSISINMNKKKMIKADTHIHPYENEKSLAGMRKFVLEANKNGFDEICFTEHAYLLPGRTENAFKRYINFAMDLKNEFSYPRINIGVELDYHPEKLYEIHKIIEDFPFDYVLGSVHIHTTLYKNEVSGFSFQNISLFTIDMILEAVKSNLFDAISHLDFFRMLIPEKEKYNPAYFKDGFLEIFKEMEKRDIALEINTSGLRRSFQSLHPEPEILKWANDFDLNYTFGSDAHESRFVGFGFHKALRALTKLQQENLVSFRKRKIEDCNLCDDILELNLK